MLRCAVGTNVQLGHGIGDKTVAMWLMNAELYDGMSTFDEASDVVVRGMALHKMIHAVTMCLGAMSAADFVQGASFDSKRSSRYIRFDTCKRS